MAKKRKRRPKCAVGACRKKVELPRAAIGAVMCDECWALVPEENRKMLAWTYRVGQYADPTLAAGPWQTTVRQAAEAVESRRPPKKARTKA